MARLTFIVSPGAQRSAILGRHGEGWKVHVAAPPEHGRANDALVRLLAEALGVPGTRLRLLRGRSARLKTVDVEGLSEEEAAARLDSAAAR
jgi:uncharacterized protein